MKWVGVALQFKEMANGYCCIGGSGHMILQHKIFLYIYVLTTSFVRSYSVRAKYFNKLLVRCCEVGLCADVDQRKQYHNYTISDNRLTLADKRTYYFA